MSKDKGYKVSFNFKSITTQENLSKTYVTVYDNGVTLIEQYILGNSDDSFQIVTKRFGKTLYKKEIAFKFSTLNTIHKHVIKSLEKMNLKLSDIL